MDIVKELHPQGEWSLYRYPFRHIRAERVFRNDTYQRLVKAFRAIRDSDPNGSPESSRFSVTQPAYDARMVAMDQHLASKFPPLFELPWIRFLANLLNLKVFAQVDGGLHHIPLNSRSGWVHNDFCSAWFDAGVTGEIVFPDRKKCDYFTGTPRTPDAQPREYTRAATMIFYLENDAWQPGFGGETGLYGAIDADRGPMFAVPPLSNSLLLFECSPHSYHRLIANPGSPRNSIILWLHESVDNAQSRWGSAVTRRKPK